MIAILLCAGYATRMYPVTRDFPKHLLPVAGKPAIDYLVDQILALNCIDAVHVATNDKFFHFFEEWQAKWSDRLTPGNMSIHIHNNGTTSSENQLGPAGDLYFVWQRIPESNRVLVAAGDNIFRFSLKPMYRRFLESRGHWILAVKETDVGKLQKTGVPVISADNRVTRCYEKPAQPPSTWASPLLQFYQASARSRLGQFLQTEDSRSDKGIFIDYLCQREAVYAYKTEASRFDIGNLDAFHEADMRLRKEAVYSDHLEHL